MKIKGLAILLLIIILNFLVYKQSLTFFFLSDDFYFLSQQSISDILLPKAGFYHYIPLFWTTMYGIQKIFGTYPGVFHQIALIVHCLNVFFVFVFARKITHSVKLAALSSILFAVFFAQYEVVFWVTGLSISLMVLFGLLSFIAYIQFRKSKKKYYALLCIAASIFSLFMHEYGLAILIGIILYHLTIERRKVKELFVNPIIVPVSIMGILLCLRIVFSHATFAPALNSPIYIMWYFAKIVSYLSLPNPYIVDSLPKIYIFVLSATVLLLVSKIALKDHRVRFLLLWTTISVFIVSITSAPQARYFYFLTIPFLILLVYSFKKRSIIIKFLVYSFIIISGIIFISNQATLWSKTSEITKNTFQKIYSSYRILPNDSTVYAINFPDSLNGPPWNAYLFRNGLESGLSSIYNKKVKVIYYRTIPENFIVRNDKEIAQDALIKFIKRKNAVFQFNYKTNTIDEVK